MKRFTSKLPLHGLDGMPLREGAGVETVYGKGGGSTNTIQQQEPWAPATPDMREVLAGARANYQAGPDQYYPGQLVVPHGDLTMSGLGKLTSPGYASEGIQNTADYALDIFSGNQAPTGTFQGIADPAGSGTTPNIYGGGSYAGPMAPGTELLTDSIEAVRAQSGEDFLQPTSRVDAATSLQNILDGGDSQVLQDYMASSSQNIADQIIRNNLLPQQVEQLMGGSYGGSAGYNIGREAAVDIADTIGRNNNSLILDQQQRQLSAADIVTGAQQGSNDFQVDIINSGLQGADILQSGNNAAISAATSRYNTDASNSNSRYIADSNRAIAEAQLGEDYRQFNNSLALDTATAGSQYAPIWDELQYSDAGRDLTAGAALEGKRQEVLDADVARYMYNQGADERNLTDYANLVMGVAGTGSSSTSSADGDTGASAAGALGGAAAGAGIASAAGMGWGAAAAVPYAGWAAVGIGALLGSGII